MTAPEQDYEHAPWHYTEFGVVCMCGKPMRDEICPDQLPASDSPASVSPEQTPTPPADSAHSSDQCTDHGATP